MIEVFAQLLEEAQLQLEAHVGIDAFPLRSDERESVCDRKSQYNETHTYRRALGTRASRYDSPSLTMRAAMTMVALREMPRPQWTITFSFFLKPSTTNSTPDRKCSKT